MSYCFGLRYRFPPSPPPSLPNLAEDLFLTNMTKHAFIIIPCFNEGTRIRKTVEELLPLHHEIVVIDDGSEISPWESLSNLPIHFIRHEINLGQGAALQTGLEYCRKQGADAVVHFDADGQHCPDDIARFLEALDKYDVVLGSRFLRDDDKKQVPAMKRLLLKGACIVNFFFTGLMLTDAHNGMRALGPKAIEAINLRENRMAHATEILIRIHEAKLSFCELPSSIRYTDYSKAKGQKWYNSINILIDLILNKLFF